MSLMRGNKYGLFKNGGFNPQGGQGGGRRNPKLPQGKPTPRGIPQMPKPPLPPGPSTMPVPSPFDPTKLDQIINGQGDYGDLMRQLGLPLDPQFLAERTNLMNTRESGLSQLLNQFNIGNAQLDRQSLLGNRAIDENMAARGLFGSGVERRDERLLGNDIAQQRFGLQNAYSQGQLGAQADYRTQMMASMADLAQRLQGQSNLPLPNWGPWAMTGNVAQPQPASPQAPAPRQPAPRQPRRAPRRNRRR